MSRQNSEGTLHEVVLDGGVLDPAIADSYGFIHDLADFLEKAERLTDEILQATPDSMRGRWAVRLRTQIGAIKADRTAPQTLDILLKAALRYSALLREVNDGNRPTRKTKLTRREYLAFRAKARSRKELAQLCELKTIFALAKYERAQGLPPANYNHRGRRKAATT